MEIEKMKPFFDENNLTVVFSADNRIISLLSVALISIVKNSTENNNYDIVILNKEITQENKNKLIEIAKNYKNINVRFFDLTNILSKYNPNIFFTREWFSEAAYYRLFIPEVFSEFDKILYLDCDTTVNTDIAKLFKIDMHENLICATKDIGILCGLYLKNREEYAFIREYINKNILGLKNWENYFQSAVMIFDMKKIKGKNLVEKAITELKRVKEPLWVEQCILNVIYEGHIEIIKWDWNFNITHYKTLKRALKKLPKKYFSELLNANMETKIYHYTGSKPWCYPKYLFPDFWKYAKLSPFKTEIEAKIEEAKRTNSYSFEFEGNFRNLRKLKVLYKCIFDK